MGDESTTALSLPAEAFGLHQGDSRHLQEHVAELFGDEAGESEFVDVTITSPPYADMIEYETSADDQIGFGDSYEEYLEELRSIFRQTYSLTEPEGSLWVVVNSFREEGRFVNLPGDIVQLCENLHRRDACPKCDAKLVTIRESMSPECPECGFSTRNESWEHHDTIIWDKVRARPYAQNTFRNVFEYILCFKKSESPSFNFDSVRIADESELEQWWVDWPERYHPRGKIPDNVWELVTPTQGGWNRDWPGHPAPFPPKLVERIVRLTTEVDGIVFDPFAGSGTTIAQAQLMDRRAFGFDLSDTYYENYTEVEAYLENWWAEQQANDETVALQQERLERTIWALRQLIYAKKAATKLRTDAKGSGANVETIGDLGLHSIIVDSAIPRPADHPGSVESMETTYTYVFEPGVDGTQYLSQIEAMTSEDPWDGFKIDAEIAIASSEEVHHADLPSENGGPYLYTTGQHERVARSLSEGAWEEAKEDPARWRSRTASTYCPAMISNLLVTVERSDEGPEVATGLLEKPPEESHTGHAAMIKDSDEFIDTALTDYF